MNVLIVSGVWPPDIGGPASHGPDLGRHLAARGHCVRAVTTTPGALAGDFPVVTSSREHALPVRLARGLTDIAAGAREADVVYATGLYSRSALVSRVSRVPLVLKLTNDPAYERAVNRGWFGGTLEEFQFVRRPRGAVALRRLRDASLRQAATLIVPSRYLARIAERWTVAPPEIEVVPNPFPVVTEGRPREELRARFGMTSPTLVYAGRFAPVKNLPLAVEAMGRAGRGALVLIGDGPDRDRVRAAIERHRVSDRVRLEPPVDRDEVLDWLRAADAVLLSSDSENHPHVAVEALSVGTPVIATAVGGVPEIVDAGRNGLLVGRRDAAALGEAIAGIAEDLDLLGRLRAGARGTPPGIGPAEAFSAIERALERAITRGG